MERCTSPSHFLTTPLALTPYGPDAHIDLPLRARMDSWLGGCVGLFFSARASVVGDDGGKMWEEVGRDKPCYSTVERLLSPLRRRRVLEQWSVREVAVFEVGMCQRPKDFAAISRLIGSKSTNEVVHFYYSAWKQSQHYRTWKQATVTEPADRPQRVDSTALDEDEREEKTQQVDVIARYPLTVQLASSAAFTAPAMSPSADGRPTVPSAVDVAVGAALVSGFHGSPHSVICRSEGQTALADDRLTAAPLTAGGGG